MQNWGLFDKECTKLLWTISEAFHISKKFLRYWSSSGFQLMSKLSNQRKIESQSIQKTPLSSEKFA